MVGKSEDQPYYNAVATVIEGIIVASRYIHFVTIVFLSRNEPILRHCSVTHLKTSRRPIGPQPRRLCIPDSTIAIQRTDFACKRCSASGIAFRKLNCLASEASLPRSGVSTFASSSDAISVRRDEPSVVLRCACSAQERVHRFQHMQESHLPPLPAPRCCIVRINALPALSSSSVVMPLQSFAPTAHTSCAETPPFAETISGRIANYAEQKKRAFVRVDITGCGKHRRALSPVRPRSC